MKKHDSTATKISGQEACNTYGCEKKRRVRWRYKRPDSNSKHPLLPHEKLQLINQLETHTFEVPTSRRQSFFTLTPAKSIYLSRLSIKLILFLTFFMFLPTARAQNIIILRNKAVFAYKACKNKKKLSQCKKAVIYYKKALKLEGKIPAITARIKEIKTMIKALTHKKYRHRHKGIRNTHVKLKIMKNKRKKHLKHRASSVNSTTKSNTLPGHKKSKQSSALKAKQRRVATPRIKRPNAALTKKMVQKRPIYTPEASSRQSHGHSSMYKGGIASIASGILIVGLGGVMSGLAVHEKNGLAGLTSLDELDKGYSKINTYNVVAITSYVIGAAAIGTGIILMVKGRKKAKSRVTTLIGPSSIGVMVRY